MLSEKEELLRSRQRFIGIFYFQNSQANIADAATIKALPASDNNIGVANGHSSNATIAEAAAVHSCHLAAQGKPPSPVSSNSKFNKRSLQSSKVNLQRALVCIKAENFIISSYVFKVQIMGQAMIYNRSIEGSSSLPQYKAEVSV